MLKGVMWSIFACQIMDPHRLRQTLWAQPSRMYRKLETGCLNFELCSEVSSHRSITVVIPSLVPPNMLVPSIAMKSYTDWTVHSVLWFVYRFLPWCDHAIDHIWISLARPSCYSLKNWEWPRAKVKNTSTCTFQLKGQLHAGDLYMYLPCTCVPCGNL